MEQIQNRILQKISILIDGYAKAILRSQYNSMSIDITYTIISFYWCSIGFIVSTRYHRNTMYNSSSYYTMTLADLFPNKSSTSNKPHETIVKLVGDKKSIYMRTHSSQNKPRQTYMVNHTALPYQMKHKLLSDLNPSQSLLSCIPSNQWNLIFTFEDNIFHATALHPSLYNVIPMSQYDQLSDFSNVQYLAYNFEIPCTGYTTCSSYVYNRSDEILFSFHNGSIDILDFKFKSDHDAQTEFKWERNWCYNRAMSSMYGNSLCMVDDRFIACMHYSSKQATLFALNCKQCVKIADMCKAGTFEASSIYHDTFHKILVGDQYIQCYDINKDVWTMVTDIPQIDECAHQLTNIWYTAIDPQMVYLCRRCCHDVCVFSVDLRLGKTNVLNKYGKDLKSKKNLTGVMKHTGDNFFNKSTICIV